MKLEPHQTAEILRDDITAVAEVEDALLQMLEIQDAEGAFLKQNRLLSEHFQCRISLFSTILDHFGSILVGKVDDFRWLVEATSTGTM